MRVEYLICRLLKWEDLDMQGSRVVRPCKIVPWASNSTKKTTFRTFDLRPGFPSSQLMQHTGARIPAPPWGIPVEITWPANAVGKLEKPPPWNSLRFSPIGVYHLRCWQGVFPGVRNFFVACQSRFRSADIAWFCSGSSHDNNHNHPRVSFHPSLKTLFTDTNSYLEGKEDCKLLLREVKDLMFDSVRVSLDAYMCLITYLLTGYDVRSVNRWYDHDYFQQWHYGARFSHPS